MITIPVFSTRRFNYRKATKTFTTEASSLGTPYAWANAVTFELFSGPPRPPNNLWTKEFILQSHKTGSLKKFTKVDHVYNNIGGEVELVATRYRTLLADGEGELFVMIYND